MAQRLDDLIKMLKAHGEEFVKFTDFTQDYLKKHTTK